MKPICYMMMPEELFLVSATRQIRSCRKCARDVKLMLEAMQSLEKRWAEICETSTDSDEVADFGNDLIELRLLQATTLEAAISAFGKNVANF